MAIEIQKYFILPVEYIFKDIEDWFKEHIEPFGANLAHTKDILKEKLSVYIVDQAIERTPILPISITNIATDEPAPQPEQAILPSADNQNNPSS